MSTFVNYFFFAPLFATFFGFLGWMVPAILSRGALPRRRVSVYALFHTGYAIIAVLTLFLLVVGTQTPTRAVEPDGQVHFVAGARSHEVLPLLGTAASFAVVWLVRREWLRRRGAR
ncbi:hypothetical protein [Frankia sp. Cr1]|uniref:hypothetical protein n=1 Tax=Frankia sp. Cr1 TaxID=3073931 RepID=UPI002AD48568|nr:hypothetical protein [Frankia sp. Cr1]